MSVDDLSVDHLSVDNQSNVVDHFLSRLRFFCTGGGRERRGKEGERGGEGGREGGGTYSSVAGLSHVTIDYASLFETEHRFHS